jgi:hypothetical protein
LREKINGPHIRGEPGGAAFAFPRAFQRFLPLGTATPTKWMLIKSFCHEEKDTIRQRVANKEKGEFFVRKKGSRVSIILSTSKSSV